MFKVLGFLKKKEDLSMKEFIDYYENHHVPLILSVAPAPLRYRRHYLHENNEITKSGNTVAYDAISELGFADEAAFQSWIKAVTAPGSSETIETDEARFLSRSYTCAYLPLEYVTF